MNTQSKDGQKNEIRPVFAIVVIFVALGIGFAGGYRFHRCPPTAITTHGCTTVELRYNQESRWFELYENGLLRSEMTATDLGLEFADDPKDWRAYMKNGNANTQKGDTKGHPPSTARAPAQPVMVNTLSGPKTRFLPAWGEAPGPRVANNDTS